MNASGIEIYSLAVVLRMAVSVKRVQGTPGLSVHTYAWMSRQVPGHPVTAS